MLLLVRLCLWWVGVLIGVVGVQRVKFLIADRTVGQNALRATTLASSSALGRTRTCGDQPLEVVAVGSLYALLTLIHHEVHVSTPGRVRVQRRPVLLDPLCDAFGIGRVRVDARIDRRPVGIAIAEGRIVLPYLVHRAIYRVEVHE